MSRQPPDRRMLHRTVSAHRPPRPPRAEHFQTPPSQTSSHIPAVGLGINAPMPADFPETSSSYPPYADQQSPGAELGVDGGHPGASFDYEEEEEEEEAGDGDGEITEGEADEEDDEEEGVEDDEDDGMSETSSAMFDQEADPEGWAKRLDELAGVLEMGEEEARSLRWGPKMGKRQQAPDLPLDQFKALLNHHLTSTEWKYLPPASLFPPPLARPGMIDPIDLLDADISELHPIPILGRRNILEPSLHDLVGTD